MKLIKCEVCQAILGERKEEGIAVKKENHKEILIDGVVKIWCENNHLNLVGMSGSNTKLTQENEDTAEGVV